MIHMCPDPHMLSLYYDRELPSPWREKLEVHAADCSSCRNRLEQFRLLSETLEGAPSPGFAGGLSARQERVWQRLNGPVYPAPPRKSAWSRSVRVPLPAAVAAAALILAFSVFFAGSLKTAPAADSEMASLDMQTMMPFSDMSEVLQYLGNDDSPNIMIIRLPESRSFMRSGEPAIMRVQDYGGGDGLKSAKSQ
jgi:hypothetical protein